MWEETHRSCQLQSKSKMKALCETLENCLTTLTGYPFRTWTRGYYAIVRALCQASALLLCRQGGMARNEELRRESGFRFLVQRMASRYL